MAPAWVIAAGLIPSIAVALIFWLVMRAVIRGDRREREAQAKLDEELSPHS